MTKDDAPFRKLPKEQITENFHEIDSLKCLEEKGNDIITMGNRLGWFKVSKKALIEKRGKCSKCGIDVYSAEKITKRKCRCGNTISM